MSPGWRPLRAGSALVLAALLLSVVAALPALADTTYDTPAYDYDTRADAAHRITPESDETVVRWVQANGASSSEVIARTDVYAQQRGREQLAHDAYMPALNRIRPISPAKPNLTTYLDAADEFLANYGGG